MAEPRRQPGVQPQRSVEPARARLCLKILALRIVEEPAQFFTSVRELRSRPWAEGSNPFGVIPSSSARDLYKIPTNFGAAYPTSCRNQFCETVSPQDSYDFSVKRNTTTAAWMSTFVVLACGLAVGFLSSERAFAHDLQAKVSPESNPIRVEARFDELVAGVLASSWVGKGYWQIGQRCQAGFA